MAVVGDQATAVHQVRKQQGMVDDHDVRLFGLLSRAAKEAGAAIPQPGTPPLFSGGDAVPRECVAARQVDLTPVSGDRVLEPDRGLAEQPRVLHRGILAARQIIPAAQAQVISPTLEQSRLHHALLDKPRRFQNLNQRRYVFAP